MSKKIIALAFAVLALAGCGESVTGGDTICGMMDRKLYADDVFGTGPYKEYQDEFLKKTGCQSALNCTESMTIKEDVCLEDIEVK
ncbi:MAG: hypothetical protein J5615_01580 [Fibrobacter sp.]|nr:hypothetical protein [Fibrobacter sp.]